MWRRRDEGEDDNENDDSESNDGNDDGKDGNDNDDDVVFVIWWKPYSEDGAPRQATNTNYASPHPG